MPNPIGYSFAPTFENSELARGRGATGAQPHEALQVLSYRLPRVTGGGSISPLVSDTMRGGPNMSVLESVFRTILGPDAAAALLSGQGAFPTGGTPNPTIRPGLDDPTEHRGPLQPVNYTDLLRDRTGGNIGFGNTGRSPGHELAPAPGAGPHGAPIARNPFAGGYRPY